MSEGILFSRNIYSSDSIWSAISREFTIDGKSNTPEVQKEIRNLLSDPDHFYKILQSAAPYIYYIHNQTKSRGLPAELSLIPVIESEYNPYDKSNKGASGLWQLMSVTASELGVRVKNGYDGRRNVIASTKAALAYFKDLGVLFHGNWYLAIAAYNCGQGAVLNAVKKAGTNNFWDLHLPQETKIYVPRLLAVAEIIKHPNKYHFKLPYISNKPYFASLETNKNITLKDAANLTGVNMDVLVKLNPDYAKGSHPSNDAKKTLLVPIEKAMTAENYLNT